MSTAFTTPSGETLQSLAFYNELQLAYSERRQALGQSAQSVFSDDDYWQKLSMYQGWQNWMEANCTSFIDHISGPLNPAEDDFLYFTLATWRAAAGLNIDGFSRYDKDGNFIGYGIAQDNDLICDKLFLELQTGFSALRWTLQAGEVEAFSSDSARASRSPDQSDNCAQAVASQKANWPDGTWGVSLYRILARLQGPAPWWCVGQHAAGKSFIRNIPVCCPHSAECYLSPGLTSDIYEYEDMENLFNGINKFVLWENFPESQVDYHILSNLIGDYTVNPVDLTNIAICPDGSDGAGCIVTGHAWILKWNFTNT